MKTTIAIVAVMLLVLLGIPQVSANGNANPILTVRIAATQDTYIDQALPTTNFCTGITVLAEAAAGATTFRTLVNLSIADLPINAKILSAKYYGRVTYSDTDNSPASYNRLEFFFITSSWSECGVTWNNQPTVSGVFLEQAVNDATQAHEQPFAFDIVGFIKAKRDTGFGVHGFEIRFLSDTIDDTFRSLQWRSANYSALGGYETDDSGYVTIDYQLPTATIYPAYYCSGGPCETGILSGSGLPAYLFNITYAENNGTFRRAPRPDLLLTNVSTYFTFRGSDFFGNLLFNQSKVVTSSTFLWTVQIPYGIFQVYSMRDTFTSISVKPTGGTAMLFDLPPRAWWALPLKTGVSYFLNFTLLNPNFVAIATINIVRTMGSKLSFIVNGTTLSQVSQNQNGAWEETNTTGGRITGIGNILNAPKGLDFFRDLTALPMFLFLIPIGTNFWTFLLIGTVIAAAFFGSAYRKRLSQNVARWPVRMQIWATVLILSGFFLFLAATFYVTTGQFIIPFPISNAG